MASIVLTKTKSFFFSNFLLLYLFKSFVQVTFKKIDALANDFLFVPQFNANHYFNKKERTGQNMSQQL